MAATRAASREELAALIGPRLDEMLLQGTTTAEVKSGYGLETAAESARWRRSATRPARHPVSVVPTFLGAHEVPPEHRASRERYVELLIDEMIPEVARRRPRGLRRRVLRAGRVHASTRAGASCSRRARARHEAARPRGRAGGDRRRGAGGRARRALRRPPGFRLAARACGRWPTSGCVATLLPAAAFYLRLGRFAPARALIEAGVPVALATDANPGGGLSPSLPFAMALALLRDGPVARGGAQPRSP